MWIDVETTPETITANVSIDQVVALRHKLTDRLRDTRGRGQEVFLRRLCRRLKRIDELDAIETWLRVWRDTVWQIPGHAWRPLA